MKTRNRIVPVLAVSAILLTSPSVVSAFERELLTQADRMERKKAAEPEIVKWVGTIKDDADSHTTEHEHELKFTRQDNGDTYDIVDSPELVKVHHDTEKNYVMEIEAEKTPKFLFWGGNLVVKSFKVIKEASERIPHRIAAVSKFSGARSSEHYGRGGRS